MTTDEVQPGHEPQLRWLSETPPPFGHRHALVKPTIMARKMMRASRGADPKRTAEPRRAVGRRAREVTTQTETIAISVAKDN